MSAGSGIDDDAVAPTLAAVSDSTLPERSSRSEIEQLQPGAQLGRYRLQARLGAGAMGVVWSAHDPKLDRDVAIKLVHAELANDEASERLMREAKAMAKLSHRSVITVYDADDVDGKLFIAMELVRGTTLGQMLRERDAAAIADWRKWLRMMIEAGHGLAEAHENGVLHRDFKPDNVLVDGSGRVCVGDFGLALLGESIAAQSRQWNARDLSKDSIELTTTGALLGTPLYMGPQQLGGETIDARADQFAFCVAAWEALYGTRPFVVDARGIEAVAMLIAAIVRGPKPPPPSQVPEAVRAVLERGLAVAPDARWPDMDTLLVELERAARAPTTQAPRRSRKLPIAIGAVIVLAAIGVVFAAMKGRSRGTPATGRPELVKLFRTPLSTRSAISASGKTFALANEVIEVRSPDGHFSKTIPLPGPGNVFHIELDDREVRFSIERRRWHWRYREEDAPVLDGDNLPGRWRGTTIAGELMTLTDRSFVLVKPDGTMEKMSPQWINVVVISPDRKRVAYIEDGRFTGEIVVRDVDTGRAIRSGVMDEPTAMVWESATTLIFATGTLDRPRIERVDVSDGWGTPSLIHETKTGWFSDLLIGGGQLHVVTMSPAPRGRIIHRGTSTTRSDLDSVSLGLAWDPEDNVVMWNASNRQVRPSSTSSATLATEPMNATLAGDVLLATLRERGGRGVVAVPLAGGAPLWEKHKELIGVRCAGDRKPPCVAIRRVREDLDQLVAIDPRTGATESKILFESRRIDDIAVRADGQRIAITAAGLPPNVTLREITATGELIADHEIKNAAGNTALLLIRSIAYDPGGGFIVGGTSGRNLYQVGLYRDGHYELLEEARDKILSLVRPSSDGNRIIFVARGFEPELYLLRYP